MAMATNMIAIFDSGTGELHIQNGDSRLTVPGFLKDVNGLNTKTLDAHTQAKIIKMLVNNSYFGLVPLATTTK